MCERFVLPGGLVAHVCGGHRRRRPKCHYCSWASDVQCDGPKEGGGTCDRHCCRAHAKKIGANLDLCVDCVKAAVRDGRPTEQPELF